MSPEGEGNQDANSSVFNSASKMDRQQDAEMEGTNAAADHEQIREEEEDGVEN